MASRLLFTATTKPHFTRTALVPRKSLSLICHLIRSVEEEQEEQEEQEAAKERRRT
jgi:hypothetical protein